MRKETGSLLIPSDEIQALAQRLDRVDLVVGVVGLSRPSPTGDSVNCLRQRLQRLSPDLRTVLVHPQTGQNDSSPDTPNGSGPDSPIAGEAVRVVTPRIKISSRASAMRSVFELSEQTGARACAVLDPGSCTEPAQAIEKLILPILQGQADFIIACHAHEKFESKLTDSILYPMVRVLYGVQLRQPSSGEFCFGQVLHERFMSAPAWQDYATGRRADIWFSTQACCAGARIAQVGAGRRQPQDASEPHPELGDLVAKSIGGLFSEMEGDAAVWNRIRGSMATPLAGQPLILDEDNSQADPARLLESTQIGFRNLQQIWGQILSPSTVIELRRILLEPAPQFRFPDLLWVRVVYEFALAFHFHTINREHLLRSLTPLYLGWLASHVLEMHLATTAQFENRIEKLCREFESQKPYLISRWRSPDRFNP